MKNQLLLASLLFISSNLLAEDIKWQQFSEDAFIQAASNKKLVILDLEAIWCHWCHVMEKETYSNPQVQELINTKFIAVKADQDSRPDLSTRYQDFGWPATIVLNSNGEDLLKLSGFVPPQEFLKELSAIVKNPVPASKEESHATPNETLISALPQEIKEELAKRHKSSSDTKLGGLKTSHKYIDQDTIEYSLFLARNGDSQESDFSKLTFDNNLKIMDPAWGGVYQYSTHENWDNPHYEKIITAQARAIKSYAYGNLIFKDQRYLDAANATFKYVSNFLTSPEGAIYTSQDADLIRGQHSDDYFRLTADERAKKGIPAIDKHTYARENGLVIEALSVLYSVSGDNSALAAAKRSAEWAIKNRSLEGGGFSHDQKDATGPYLRDNLAMAEGLIALYHATAERVWLKHAIDTGNFIIKHFAISNSNGIFSSDPKTAGMIKPVKLNEENIIAARLFNMLYHYTGSNEFKSQSQSILTFLSNRSNALRYVTEPGILLADYEISNAPLHITIVANKDDETAKALFKAGLEYPTTYKRLEWWDKREGAMPNPDVEYPQLPKSAAFVCTNKRCSLPIFTPEGIAKTIELFAKKKI